MTETLRQLNSVPGVVGALLCNRAGSRIASTIPSTFSQQALEKSASAVATGYSGLDNAIGTAELLDLRYGDARVLVKRLPSGFVMVLCARTLNLQILLVALGGIAGSLNKGLSEKAEDVVPVEPVTDAGEGGVILVVEQLATTGNTFWTQKSSFAALNRETALTLCRRFHTGKFKKIKLTNQLTGRSKSFPAVIMEGDDKKNDFTGKVVITLAIAETLQVKPGDRVLAELTVGGGLFGWEGI